VPALLRGVDKVMPHIAVGFCFLEAEKDETQSKRGSPVWVL
jgi:hypothetical protein